ncbi:cupredoxin domain-containing protein [Burkholderia thailandensis]|uniref:Nitrous-oxide reductase n=2 Tax=Burkholderia thailandensis TaxID=57975 RepID=A0AAW9CST4_BURTH|nr:cupredoxin domain-containing protein [Burkholderia thailandensis]ABC37047.1 cytochrome c oxidase family protein [Burkholderia thailandensis E264]AHI63383.1 cytochrome C oxidase subunit II, periplasmic domain protein [Burkholderia thailandensis H0587]AHI73586.1 cytochrome C oxidase subunit II, periplasmic domain protein [Burkholderia thailandensis 2002721723]AHI77919.1 cytochrome C oxidase subunit II, periplasmic domain protein [Burkholderia thailandensis E444]AIC86675.1 cytochrome C oxidase
MRHFFFDPRALRGRAQATVPSASRRRWLFAAGGAALAVLAGVDAPHVRAAPPRVIKVHARRFVFTPDRIALAPHESVVFELTAQDTVMGFSIPQYGVRADVPPGALVHLAAQAGDPGTVQFLCDIFCGSGHETMNGVLVVG